jgi:glycosyltransferase involved in cell wall biosynthesis
VAKKIIFVDRLGAHSIWNVLDPIAQALVKRGVEVCYCRMDDGKQRVALPPPEGVHAIDIKVPYAKTKLHFILQQLAWLFHFSSFLFKFKPDLTHTNFVLPGALARFACKVLRKGKVASTRHELKQSMNPLLKLLEHHTSGYADHIVHISQVVEDSYSQTKILNSIIHNGIDVSSLEKVSKPWGERNLKRIVCVGRILPVKGQALLLEAMPLIITQYPNTELVLIGAGSDENKIRQQAINLSIDKKVKITGWIKREEVIKTMASSGLIVVPSDGTQEGFGLVVAEGLALELPMVCSDIPVFREVAGDTALMFKTGDNQSLADVIIHIFENSSAAESRSMKGKQRVKDKFTVDLMVDGYLKVYENLLANKFNQ